MAFTKLEPNSINTLATFTFAGAHLGPASNVKISGGTSGQVLSTDGSGNLSWVNQSSGGSGSFSGNYEDLNHLPVLFSGNYEDLNHLPVLFDGTYANLTGKPTLFSGNYEDLNNLPVLFDGEYSSLANKPTLFDGSYANLTGKPTLFSGSYIDLTNKPSIPTTLTDLGIYDGVSGQVLATDGSGHFSFITVSGGSGSSSSGSGFINITKDIFTATGSANTFTLSVTPSDVKYVSVNIDGLVQHQTAFSLSGNVVTISGSPAAGEIIEIITYGQGGLPGGSDTQIQFNDSGSFQGDSTLTFSKVSTTLSANNVSANNVTINKQLNIQQTSESVVSPSGTTYNFNTGAVFFTTSAAQGANFTPNFTNIPTTDGKVIMVGIIINQGSTPYMPTADANIQIDGTNYTVKWGGGSSPIGRANSLQVVSYSLLRFGSAWYVTGSSQSYY